MRALLQRALRAEVRVAGEVVGALDAPGLLVLLGVRTGDTVEDARRLAARTFGLRVLQGELSAEQTGSPLLVVSQFTLYADTRKRRPSWSQAAPGPVAEPLVETYVQALADAGARVTTGRFGADMQVELVNDGPSTVLLES